MKPGSKAWMMFMKKLYCFSEGILIFSLVSKFLLWQMPELKSPIIVSLTNVSIMTGVFNLAIIYLISMFEPVHLRPDWAIVYPQLRGTKEQKSTKTKK